MTTEPEYQSKSTRVKVFRMTASAMADRESWPEWLKERFIRNCPDTKTVELWSGRIYTYVREDDYCVIEGDEFKAVSPARFSADYEPVSDTAMAQDLAMLVRRLIMTIKHHSIWPMVAQQASDYLTRHNLQGSPLREETKGEKV